MDFMFTIIEQYVHYTNKCEFAIHQLLITLFQIHITLCAYGVYVKIGKSHDMNK